MISPIEVGIPQSQGPKIHHQEVSWKWRRKRWTHSPACDLWSAWDCPGAVFGIACEGYSESLLVSPTMSNSAPQPGRPDSPGMLGVTPSYGSWDSVMSTHLSELRASTQDAETSSTAVLETEAQGSKKRLQFFCWGCQLVHISPLLCFPKAFGKADEGRRSRDLGLLKAKWIFEC